MTLLAQCLMSMHGILGSIPAVHKLVMVAYTLSVSGDGGRRMRHSRSSWAIFWGQPGLPKTVSKKRGGGRGIFRTSVVCYKKDFLDYVFPALIFFFQRRKDFDSSYWLKPFWRLWKISNRLIFRQNTFSEHPCAHCPPSRDYSWPPQASSSIHILFWSKCQTIYKSFCS